MRWPRDRRRLEVVRPGDDEALERDVQSEGTLAVVHAQVAVAGAQRPDTRELVADIAVQLPIAFRAAAAHVAADCKRHALDDRSGEAKAAQPVPPIHRAREVARLAVRSINAQPVSRPPVPSAGEHVERPCRVADRVPDERSDYRLSVREVEGAGIAAKDDRFRAADRGIERIDPADEP